MSDERTTEKQILKSVLLSTLLRCESWSEVADGGEGKTNGRYGVTVFFDSREEARNYMIAIRAVTVSV